MNQWKESVIASQGFRIYANQEVKRKIIGALKIDGLIMSKNVSLLMTWLKTKWLNALEAKEVKSKIFSNRTPQRKSTNLKWLLYPNIDFGLREVGYGN